MTDSPPEATDQEASSAPVTQLTADEARRFFLKSESYCSIDLPSYFDFAPLLTKLSGLIAGRPVQKIRDAHSFEHVNHTIFSNKDGNFDWRPYQLINPIIYIDLVNAITRRDEWSLIAQAFEGFKKPNVECVSIPISNATARKDRAETVNRWWHDFEQRSIQLALEYEYLAVTDIVDCYGAIYTHAIAWAIHGRETAKADHSQALIGNLIDKRFMYMHFGQTNGIPQGSVLSDFVAEIVLGWVDTELAKLIEKRKIEDYKVLRYRDDYRIFASSRGDAESVLQLLSETLREVGFRLNVGKTRVTDDVIGASMKGEKMAWLMRRPRRNRNRRLDTLLDIRHHSMAYPGAGSLNASLSGYFKLLKRKGLGRISAVTLASVAVDIAARNPRTYPQVAAILSVLVGLCSKDEQQSIVNGAVNRLGRTPNSGHMEIWLKEIVRHLDHNVDFEEKLCAVIGGSPTLLWDCSWVKTPSLLEAVREHSIVNLSRFEEMKLPFDDDEVSLFADMYNEL